MSERSANASPVSIKRLCSHCAECSNFCNARMCLCVCVPANPSTLAVSQARSPIRETGQPGAGTSDAMLDKCSNQGQRIPAVATLASNVAVVNKIGATPSVFRRHRRIVCHERRFGASCMHFRVAPGTYSLRQRVLINERFMRRQSFLAWPFVRDRARRGTSVHAVTFVLGQCGPIASFRLHGLGVARCPSDINIVPIGGVPLLPRRLLRFKKKIVHFQLS